MKSTWRKSLRYTSLAILLLLALAVLCLQTLPNLFGYPKWVGKAIAEAMVPEDGTCTLGAIHGGIFTGFEIENFRLEASTEMGQLKLIVPDAGLNLRLIPLLTGHIQPKEAYVRNAEFQLLLPSDETHTQKDSLTLRQLTGSIHTTSYHVLQAQAKGNFQGMSLSADATLLGIRDLRKLFSIDKTDSFFPKDIVETLRACHREFNTITERAYDSFLNISLTADSEEWDQCSLQGTLGISDATIQGLILPTVRGTFNYKNNLLNVQDFQILYTATEMVAGKGAIDLNRKTFRSDLWADLMPDTIIQMLSMPADILPRNIRFNTPIHFTCDLPDSPWTQEELSPVFFFTCDNILVSDLRLNKLSGLLHLDKNILDMRNLQLYVGTSASEFLSGNCTLDLNTSLWNANLQGTMNLCEMLHAINLLESRDTPFEAFTRAKIQAKLDKSPIDDWKLWQGKFSITQDASAIAKIPLQNMRLDIGFKEQMLQAEFSATVAEESLPNQISLKAKTFVNDDLAQKPVKITLEPQIQVRDETALSITGQAILDLQQHTFQIDDGIAKIRPELLRALLQKPFQLDDESILSYFTCRNPQKPACLTFSMPPFAWRNAKDTWDWEKTPWEIRGKTTMEEMTLLDTDFSLLHSTIVLKEKDIDFPDLSGQLADGITSTTGHLNIAFSPFSLFYDDLSLEGSPIAIADLMFGENVIQIYQKIWKDFHWFPEFPAHLHVDHMQYTSKDGIFTLKGQIEAKNFLFQKLPIQELAMDVDLSLPDEGLRLDNIRLLDKQDSPETLTGDATLFFNNGIYGSFHSAKKNGMLHTIDLLATLFPSLADELQLFDLSPEANYTCDGRFRLDDNITLSMQGTLETPYMQYRHIQLQNLKGTWKVSNNNFFWNFPTAEFFGGTLATTGIYDFYTSSSDILANAKDIPLSKLVQLSQEKLLEEKLDEISRKYNDGELPGKLNADGHFRLLRNWAGKPLHVEGNGKVAIHDADLWRVPTLTTLGKIIAGGTLNFFSRDKISTLGRISRLDADFACHGQTIAVRDIHTDGSFIALKGSGEYDLDDNQMYFQISGQLLKSVSIISWLLRPITWAFDAELTGTPEKHEWHLKNSIMKLFQ